MTATAIMKKTYQAVTPASHSGLTALKLSLNPLLHYAPQFKFATTLFFLVVQVGWFHFLYLDFKSKLTEIIQEFLLLWLLLLLDFSIAYKLFIFSITQPHLLELRIEKLLLA